ncbi:MAG: hypothetical protein K2X27_10215 [Candidatus Obscuribacterales bacterium]|nr:hypothetical protein [Candidatus Obscuribacterales bacterium]
MGIDENDWHRRENDSNDSEAEMLTQPIQASDSQTLKFDYSTGPSKTSLGFPEISLEDSGTAEALSFVSAADEEADEDGKPREQSPSARGRSLPSDDGGQRDIVPPAGAAPADGTRPINHAVSTYTPEALRAIPANELQSTSPEQVRALNAQQLSVLSSEQISALGRNLTPQQISSLTNEQARGLSVYSLSPEQISALRPEQVPGMRFPLLLSDEQQRGLRPDVIEVMSTEQLGSLHMRELSAEQAAALSPAQIRQFSARGMGGGLRELMSMSDRLSREQFQAIDFRNADAEMLRNMRREDSSRMSSEQRQSLSPLQRLYLENPQPQNMTAEQLALLPARELQDLMRSNTLSREQIRGLTPEQISQIREPRAIEQLLQRQDDLSDAQLRQINIAAADRQSIDLFVDLRTIRRMSDQQHAFFSQPRLHFLTATPARERYDAYIQSILLQSRYRSPN